MGLLTECPECAFGLRTFRRTRYYVVFCCRCGFRVRLDRRTGEVLPDTGGSEARSAVSPPAPDE